MRFQQTWKPKDGFSMDDVSEQCQENLREVMKRSLKLGIDHIETAKMYGCSELQLGQVLKDFPRDSYILQTKVSWAK